MYHIVSLIFYKYEIYILGVESDYPTILRFELTLYLLKYIHYNFYLFNFFLSLLGGEVKQYPDKKKKKTFHPRCK